MGPSPPAGVGGSSGSYYPPDHLGESWACSDSRKNLLLVMFFLKKEDRPGRAPPLAARVGYTLRWPWSSNPLGDSRGFCSWRVPGPNLTLSWLIFAFKTSKTPPAGGPKTLFILVFFNVFAFQSYLDPTRPPRRLQEPPTRFREPLRRLQEPPRRLLKPLKRTQEHPRGVQDTPRARPKSNNGSSRPSRRFQDPPKRVQDHPKCPLEASRCLQDASKTPQDAPRRPPRLPSSCQVPRYARYVCPQWPSTMSSCRGHVH